MPPRQDGRCDGGAGDGGCCSLMGAGSRLLAVPLTRVLLHPAPLVSSSSFRVRLLGDLQQVGLPLDKVPGQELLGLPLQARGPQVSRPRIRAPVHGVPATEMAAPGAPAPPNPLSPPPSRDVLMITYPKFPNQEQVAMPSSTPPQLVDVRGGRRTGAVCGRGARRSCWCALLHSSHLKRPPPSSLLPCRSSCMLGGRSAPGRRRRR